MATTLLFCNSCLDKRVRDVKTELEDLFQKKQVDLFTCGICGCEIPSRKELIDEDAIKPKNATGRTKIKLESVEKTSDAVPKESAQFREDVIEVHWDSVFSPFEAADSEEERNPATNCSDQLRGKEETSLLMRKELVDEDATPQLDETGGSKTEDASVGEATKVASKEMCKSREDGTQNDEADSDWDLHICEGSDVEVGATTSNNPDEMKNNGHKIKAGKKQEETSRKRDAATFVVTNQKKSRLETIDLNPQFIEETILEGSVKCQKFACKICTKEFKLNAATVKKFCFHLYSEHKKQTQVPKPFKCRSCEGCFRDFRCLQQHRKDHTNIPKTKTVMCEVCGKTFAQRRQLRKHWITHSDERPYQCQACPYKAKRLHTLQLHIKSIHTDPNKFTCKYCGLTFVAASDCTEHEEWHQGGMKELPLKPYKCTDCGFEARNPHDIYQHSGCHTDVTPKEVCKSRDDAIKNDGGSAAANCSDEMNEELPKFEAAKTQEKASQNIYATTCLLTGKRKIELKITDLNPQFRKEMILEGSLTSEKFACKICKKEFNLKATTVKTFCSHLISEHGKQMQVPKPFKCRFCEACFRDFAALKHHTKDHTDKLKNKTVMCEVCGKTFALPGQLRKHRVTHSEVRPYQCVSCPYRAKRLHTLHLHIKSIHTDPNKFTCKYCGLTFVSTTVCTKHEKEHQGGTKELPLKRYKCTDCGFHAAKPCEIRKHRRVHTGEKPFKCLYCEKDFTQKGHCKTHMKLCKKR